MAHVRLVFTMTSLVFLINLSLSMAMALGPDYTDDLGFSVAYVGWVYGSFTLAATLSGFFVARFLDRIHRRRALLLSLLGLALCLCLTGLVKNFQWLIVCRILSGFLGGPLFALTQATITDYIPAERRGWAMARLMLGVSLSQIVGVPLSLQLSQWFGWRLPFLFFGVVGLCLLLPVSRLTMNLNTVPETKTNFRPNTTMKLTYLTSFCLRFGSFLLIPNLATYLVGNLESSRESLGLTFLLGGSLGLVATLIAGNMADRWGVLKVLLVGTLVEVILIYVLFISGWQDMPVLWVYVGFIVGLSISNLGFSTLLTHVPPPGQRAGFMAGNVALQYFAVTCGSFLGARMLSESEPGVLVGMAGVATISITMALVVPMLAMLIERRRSVTS